MKRTETKYVAMDPCRCVACWKCVDQCPRNVIGKAGFLWHRHVAFENADGCIGCGKCVKTCPNGVFFRPDEADPVRRESRSVLFRMERLQPLAFLASAVTGIGLHVAGHGAGHELWHNWGVAHVLASLLWLLSAGFHVRQHGDWYKKLVLRGIAKKEWATLVLSAVFPAVTVTGVVLLCCVDGPDSAAGLWHYQLGILLLLFSLFHAFRRR